MDDPHATEADRIEAAEFLEGAETRMRDLTAAPVTAEIAASFLGREVADAKDGALLGPVETTKILNYPPFEPVEAPHGPPYPQRRRAARLRGSRSPRAHRQRPDTPRSEQP